MKKWEKQDAVITVVVIRTETTKAKLHLMFNANYLTGRKKLFSDVCYFGGITAEGFT